MEEKFRITIDITATRSLVYEGPSDHTSIAKFIEDNVGLSGFQSLKVESSSVRLPSIEPF